LKADNAANAPCSEANLTRCYIAGLFCGRSKSETGRPFRPETQGRNDTPAPERRYW